MVKNMAKQADFHSGFVGIKARAAKRNNVSFSERKRYTFGNLKEKRKRARNSPAEQIHSR